MSLIKEQYELIKPTNISLSEIKRRLRLHWIESSIIIHIGEVIQVLSTCVHKSNLHSKHSFPNDMFIKKQVNPLTLPFKPVSQHSNLIHYINKPKIKQRIIIEETTDESSFPKDKSVLPNKIPLPSLSIDKQHSISISPHLQVEQAYSTSSKRWNDVNYCYASSSSQHKPKGEDVQSQITKTDKHCDVDIKEVIGVIRNLNPIEQTHLNNNDYGIVNVVNSNDNSSLLNNTIKMQSLLLSPIPNAQETQSSFSSFTQELHLHMNTNNALQTELKTPITQRQQQQQQQYKHLPQNFSNCVCIKNVHNNKYESSFNNASNHFSNNHSLPLQVVSSAQTTHRSLCIKRTSHSKYENPARKPQKYYIKDY